MGVPARIRKARLREDPAYRLREYAKDAIARKIREQNPEYREHRKKLSTNFRKSDRRRGLLYAAKKRANYKNIPFDLSLEDIVIPDVCPVLGIILEHGDGVLKDTSPTLDRISPELGYVRGNIIVISYKANRIKNNGTPEEVMKVAQWMQAETGSGV